MALRRHFQCAKRESDADNHRSFWAYLISLKISTTNKEPISCTEAKCDCASMWELLQQKAYLQLCSKQKDGSYQLFGSYETRARQIASFYAKMYLEDKSVGGTLNYKGRYYWMGLGAFASKTVAAIFNNKFSKVSEYMWSPTDASKAVHPFARGNLWLFMDIAPWHMAWSLDPKSFETCKVQRDFSKINNDKVKETMNNMHWSQEVLPSINYLQKTNQVDNAFDQLPVIEAGARNKILYKKKTVIMAAQKKNLTELAIHEQSNILQKICWNDPYAVAGAEFTRDPITGLISPRQMMLMHASYHYTWPISLEVSKSALPVEPYSEADKKMKAEKLDSRMKWINEVVEIYHQLMQDQKGRIFLEKHIRTIAGW